MRRGPEGAVLAKTAVYPKTCRSRQDAALSKRSSVLMGAVLTKKTQTGEEGAVLLKTDRGELA